MNNGIRELYELVDGKIKTLAGADPAAVADHLMNIKTPILENRGMAMKVQTAAEAHHVRVPADLVVSSELAARPTQHSAVLGNGLIIKPNSEYESLKPMGKPIEFGFAETFKGQVEPLFHPESAHSYESLEPHLTRAFEEQWAKKGNGHIPIQWGETLPPVDVAVAPQKEAEVLAREAEKVTHWASRVTDFAKEKPALAVAIAGATVAIGSLVALHMMKTKDRDALSDQPAMMA